MADPKNIFNFGTGDIDKDQWLKDIDNGQEEFITKYGSATNKHRTALLRQAFLDLRSRLASGDMLRRNSDGMYEFSSALNRDDKHMQEAYERALGFMGNLARKQINTPKSEPEKKKFDATTLLDEYKKHLFPGEFNEKAYWDRSEEGRKKDLTNFLNLYLKEGALDSYQDFGNFGSSEKLKERINEALDALQSGQEMDWKLGRLGFQGSWINKPKDEEEEEGSKSEEEAATEAYNKQLTLRKVALLNNITNFMLLASPETWYNFSTPLYDSTQFDNMIKEAWATGGAELDKYKNPYSVENAYGNYVGGMPQSFMNDYINNFSKNLNDYFSNLSTKYTSMYTDDKDKLALNLAYLFRKNKEGKYTYNEMILKYLTPLNDGSFLINGSEDKASGRYARYIPGKGIVEESIGNTYTKRDDLDNIFNITRQKNGGVLKAQYGTALLDFNEDLEETYPRVVGLLKQEKAVSKLEDTQFSNSENARIAATIADIASMGAAFVPGYGTAASAVLGLGSTATNFGADLADGQGLWGATKNAGFGLAADVMGLIPGLGGVGKGAKIARNLMWAVPKMMQWVNTYQGLQNAGEIKNSIMKLTSPSSMTVQDWLNVSQALQIMTGHGRSVATKIKKAGMSKTTTTTEPEHYIFTNKGEQKVSDETFKRLREARGTKARQALTLELMGEGVTLQQTRFAPWNTSTRFGAFKEVPGKTKVEVQNKHKGWFSDENLVEKAENFNPSVDIRSILYKVNPYRAYYTKRNQPVMPQRNYASFEARMNGEASPLDIRGPKQPYPTGKPQAPKVEEPKAEALKTTPKPQNNKKKKHKKHEIGGVLKALRSGGIIKGLFGIPGGLGSTNYKKDMQDVDMSLDPNELYYDPREAQSINYGSIYSTPTFIDYNNRVAHGAAGRRGTMGNLKATQGLYMHNGTQDYLSALNALKNYYTMDNGKNIMGDVLSYYNNVWLKDPNSANKTYADFVKAYNANVDTLRARHLDKFNTGKDVVNQHGWGEFNTLHRQMYGSYGKYLNDKGEVADDWNEGAKDILGESTWRRLPNAFNGKEYDALRRTYLKDGDESSYVYMDNNGHLQLTSKPKDEGLDPYRVTSSEDPASKEGTRSVDELGERVTTFQNNFKNPFDPSNLITAGKLFQAIRGNADIYGNLIKEMPQAPMRDPIHRLLAIVGNQRVIDEARNRVGALRQINRQLRGSDLQANFATTLETERVGRDNIMDKAFDLDASRQFDTAQKLWNLKNDDVLRNNQIIWENDKARKDRERMIAQIRAAWRSGDQNAIMGAMADTGNWFMKKYQTEQDLVNKAKELELGTIEQRALTELEKDAKYKQLMDKYTSGLSLTDEERAYVRKLLSEAIKNIRGKYSLDYYNMYHNSLFGGGYKQTIIGKDGTKLEVAKLKARSKDNDRYVSMIKDLRTTRSRRRRR